MGGGRGGEMWPNLLVNCPMVAIGSFGGGAEAVVVGLRGRVCE